MFAAAVEGYPAPLEDPSKWSKEFLHFLVSCLKLNPAERPSVTELLGHPFLSRAASRAEMVEFLGKVFSEAKQGLKDSMELDDS